MKRFVLDYAKDIEKEIKRIFDVLNDKRKLSVYSGEATEKASEELKNLMFYAERDLITPSDAMKKLVAIDPRNF